MIAGLNSGMRYEFLPPYSPDFNPIELAFSCMKYRLRRNGDMIRISTSQDGNEVEVLQLLYGVIYSITEHEAFGWYRHCGYV